jgi:hypothetical protein
MKKIYILGLIIVLCMVKQSIFAQPVLSAEITWQCIGQDSFLLKLDVYADCNGSAFPYPHLDVYCGTSGSLINNFAVQLSSAIDVTPVCRNNCTKCQSQSCSFPFGFRKQTAYRLVNLSAAGSCCNILISWYNSTRTSNITTGAYGASFYTSANLNRCLNPCDNSPVLSSLPTLIACVGQDQGYSLGFSDIDTTSSGAHLDSFTFDLTPPLNAAGSNITYTGQYAYNKPIYFWGFPNDALPFPRGFHFDNQTGTIQFRPMKAECTVMTVQINEFRNGVKIGEIRREWFVAVISCPNSAPQVSTAGNKNQLHVCAGDTAKFTFTSSDADSSDTVTISLNSTIHNARWTTTNGQVKQPVASFSWVTNSNDINANPYTILVKVTDNSCPNNSSSSQSYQVYVSPRVAGGYIIKTDQKCGYFNFIAQSGYAYTNYYWYGKNFTFNDTFGQIIYQKFSKPGIYPFTVVEDINGCESYIHDTINVDFTTIALPADTTIYDCDTITLKPIIHSLPGKISYLWSGGSTSGQLFVSNQKTDKTYILSVTDSSCTVKDTIKVKRNRFGSLMAKDTSICIGDKILINPYVYPYNKKLTYLWSTGDSTLKINPGPFFTDTRLKFLLSGYAGCKSLDSINIHPDNKIKIHLTETINACKESVIYIEASTQCDQNVPTYKWNSGQKTNRISVGPFRGDSLLILTATDSLNNSSSDSVKIIIKSNIKAILPFSDSTICNGATIHLTGNYTNSIGEVSYWWSTGSSDKNIYITPNFDTKLIFHVSEYFPQDHFNCYSSDTVDIKVLQLPNVSITYNGPTTFCPGDSFLLLASSGYKWQYQWFRNAAQNGISNKLYVKESGNYFVRATDTFGCSNSSQVKSLNTYDKNDELSFIATPRYFTASPYIVAFDNLTPNYLDYNFIWDFGDGNTSSIINPFHTYSDTGIYAVKLVAHSKNTGCTSNLAKADYIHCSNAITIDDFDYSDGKPLIYPNPVDELLNVDLKNDHPGNSTIEIISVSGKMLIKADLNKRKSVIDVSDLTNGVYIVKILDNNQQQIFRLIKSK